VRVLDAAADCLHFECVTEPVQHDVGAWPASTLAIPSPMPLVDPVTIATSPFNIAVFSCDAA
jgi:hypothetical protein